MPKSKKPRGRAPVRSRAEAQLRVTATVKAGTVHSGTVAGTIIKRAGTVITDGYQKPLEAATVLAYLKALASSKPGKVKGKSRKIQLLYRVPFYAHRGTDDPEKLHTVVQRVFDEDRALERSQRVVLLADPGSGKTPALEHLRAAVAAKTLRKSRAWFNSKNKEKNPPAECVIPLLINLGDLRAAASFPALIRDTINTVLDEAGNTDPIDMDQAVELVDVFPMRCLFLLDELDVLLAMHNENILVEFLRFIERQKQDQLLVTCRKTSYRGQLGTSTILFLDPMREKETKEVLGASWSKLSGELRGLALNRSMLNMMLDLGKETWTTRTKGELLRNWITSQLDLVSDGLTVQVQSLLEHLAYRMQSEHTHSYSVRELMELTKAHLQTWNEVDNWRKVVDAAAARELLVRDEMRQQWSFKDRQTETYFAAVAILHDPPMVSRVLENLTDYRWRGLLEILMGLLPNPSGLLFEMLDRDELVTANMTRFAGSRVDPRVMDAIIDALIERMGQESSLSRTRIVNQIGESGHPRAAEALVRALNRQWASIVLMAIVGWLCKLYQREPKAFEKIQGFDEWGMYNLSEQTKDLTALLATYTRACSANARERKKALDDLIATMQDHRKPRVLRSIALFGLGFSKAKLALETLVELITDQETDDFIAWCAVDALSQFDDPLVRKTAIKLFTAQEYRDAKWVRHRARALYLLGRLGVGGPGDNLKVGSQLTDFGKLLVESVGDSNHPIIQTYALEAIVQLGLQDARKRIEELVSVPDQATPWVLRKAAEQLGQIGTLDSIPVLKRYERHDRVHVRSTVRKAIAEIQERFGVEGDLH